MDCGPTERMIFHDAVTQTLGLRGSVRGGTFWSVGGLNVETQAADVNRFLAGTVRGNSILAFHGKPLQQDRGRIGRQSGTAYPSNVCGGWRKQVRALADAPVNPAPILKLGGM